MTSSADQVTSSADQMTPGFESRQPKLQVDEQMERMTKNHVKSYENRAFDNDAVKHTQNGVVNGLHSFERSA